MEKIHRKYWLIILGDFNINVNDKTCAHTRTYKNLLLSLGLSNLINVPTRVTSSSETIIDHCITNLPTSDIKTGVIQADLSDHFPIYAHANLLTKTSKVEPHHYFRNFSHTKKPAFLQKLQSNLDSSFVVDLDKPVQSLKAFTSIFQKTASLINPTKKRTCKQRKL